MNLLVVKESAQGKGAGQLLVGHAQELVREKRQSHLELKVYLANEGALNYYRKLGFEPIWQQMTWTPEAPNSD